MGSWTEMRPIPSVPHGLNRSCGRETLSPLAQAPSGPSLPIPIPRGRTHQSLTSGRTVGMCGRGGPVESNLLFQCPPSVVLGKGPSRGPSVEKSPSTIALVERSAQTQVCPEGWAAEAWGGEVT